MTVPAPDRFAARSVACLVVILLGLGAAACSGSTPPTSAKSSPQASTQHAVPPDPCKLLGSEQVSAALSQSPNQYVAGLHWNTLVVADNYATNYFPGSDSYYVTCTWNIPAIYNSGVNVEVFTLTLQPASKFLGLGTPVDNMGQAADIANLGDLEIKDGSFDIDVFDRAENPTNVAGEEKLGTDVVANLRSLAQGG